MKAITSQIDAALEAKLYFAAILMAVAIPDICAAMESEDGLASSDRYRAWYNQRLAKEFPYLSASQMYELRCGIVHQGRAKHAGLARQVVSITGTVTNVQSPLPYSRVLFTVPGPHVTLVAEGCALHSSPTGETVYLQDADLFCRAVVSAALQWPAEKMNDPIVQANMLDLFRLRPEGFEPFFRGIPIIA